eukprot:Polyplicarium_translucidae@DN2903_c0_g1_i4.p1
MAMNPPKIGWLRWDNLGYLLNFGDVQPGKSLLLLDQSMGLLTGSALLRMDGSGKIFRAVGKGTGDKIISELNTPEEWKQQLRDIPLEVLSSHEPYNSPWLTFSETEVTPDEEFAEQRLKREEQKRFSHLANVSMFEEIASEGVSSFLGVVAPSKCRSVEEVLQFVVNCGEMAHKYLQPDGKFAVYCQHMDPLSHLHAVLWQSSKWTLIKLSEFCLNRYQVLPGRSHPDMGSVTPSVGFILTAVKVE